MSGKKAKVLTEKELDRAEVRLRAGEQVRAVARFFGLRAATTLKDQLGDKRWQEIKEARAERRRGDVSKAVSYSGKSSPMSNVFGKRY